MPTYEKYISLKGAMLLTREEFDRSKSQIEDWIKNCNGLDHHDYILHKSGKLASKPVSDKFFTKPAVKYRSNQDEQVANAMSEYNAIKEEELQAKIQANAEKKIVDKESASENDSYSALLTEINTIEKTLNDCESLDDDQVLSLKDRIKMFESRLKDKIKPKTITISSSVHNKIKKYCSDFGLKIGDWVEETLLKELANLPYTAHDEEKEKEEIVKRYYESKKTNKLLKSDKLILLPNFKFKGYSQIDFKPIYDYIGTDRQFEKIAENRLLKCNITFVKRDIVVTEYLPEFEKTQVEGFEDFDGKELKDLGEDDISGLKGLLQMLKHNKYNK